MKTFRLFLCKFVTLLSRHVTESEIGIADDFQKFRIDSFI